MKTFVLAMLFTIVATACSVHRVTDIQSVSDQQGNSYKMKVMEDGKFWTTQNLRADADHFCYDDLPANCDKFGRLYTWETAIAVCSQLGEGWRLPSNGEWQTLAKPYGGVWNDSDDEGHAAYVALIDGGASEFNAILSGGKDPSGLYQRLDAHGFYWTSSATGDSTAWMYNFGKNRQSLNRHDDSEKVRAVAVRCVRDQ
jgi:uncharacterized protein (TIGR02145 family)